MGLLDRLHGGGQGEKSQTRDSGASANYRKVQKDLLKRLGEELAHEQMPPWPQMKNDVAFKQKVSDLVELLLTEYVERVSPDERSRLRLELMNEIFGYGPIEGALLDESISEIMVNGPHTIFIERKGKIILSDITFADTDHVLKVLDKIVSPLGRRIDESSPLVDARLPDGSRVNAVIAPLSLIGPVITIRKFKKDPLVAQDLVRFGTLTDEAVQVIRLCVQARLNIVVSGGTGSGKTTTLNVLSSFIPDDERIVTIEDAAELQLQQLHVVRLESRPANIEGKGEITIRTLVRNSLRMRPDRIVVGEVRGGEALDMLQAMNTGHDGSLTTLHSNSPRDTISRLETMVLMSGMELPIKAIREQISSAIDLIVHQERLKDGTRRVTRITEIVGMEQDVVTLQDVFAFRVKGFDPKRGIKGDLEYTGIRPAFEKKFEYFGLSLPPNLQGTARG